MIWFRSLPILLSLIIGSQCFAQNAEDRRLERLLVVTSELKNNSLYIEETIASLGESVEFSSSTDYSMSRFRFPAELDTIYKSFKYQTLDLKTGFLFDYVTSSYDLVGALKVKKNFPKRNFYIEGAARVGMMQVGEGFAPATKSSAVLFSTGFSL